MSAKKIDTPHMSGAREGAPEAPANPYMIRDPQAFLHNMAHMVEEAGHAAAAWVGPREKGETKDDLPESIAELTSTLGKVSEFWLSDPQRALQAQTALFSRYMDLWTSSIKRMAGEEVEDVAKPEAGDRRFNDRDWQENQFFNFLRQAYLITSGWVTDLVEKTEGLDEHTKHKAVFYAQQLINSLSPTNFPATNPEVLKETFKSDGENLVRGMRMLAEDLERGKGELRLRQADNTAFKVGRDVANTPGKVVHQNDVCQVIQYEAATDKVLKRPLVIVPPWINKFYILDLNPQKSFIKWCVEQGHTVFVVSWVNPDERQAGKSFEHYAREGIIETLDVVEDITGEKEMNLIGYCVGGTLLAVTLALMARTGDKRAATATFFTTQVDFTHAGDLKVFVDEEQIERVERSMATKGYLEGARMANAFNLLRSRDLVWPYVVDNYMKGKNPLPFDLLYWNSEFNPHAGGEPFILPAQLLPREPADPRQDGNRRANARPLRRDHPGLQSCDARGPHCAGTLGLSWLAVFRRQGNLRDDGFGAYRRGGQPAGGRKVPVLDRRQAGWRDRRLGEIGSRASRFMVAALARLDRVA